MKSIAEPVITRPFKRFELLLSSRHLVLHATQQDELRTASRNPLTASALLHSVSDFDPLVTPLTTKQLRVIVQRAWSKPELESIQPCSSSAMLYVPTLCL